MKHPFRPDHYFDGLAQLTPARLRAMGLSALLVDLDNTLARPHAAQPTPQGAAWIREMQEAGIPLVLVSNNSAQRVQKFCRDMGLRGLHGAAKPLPFGLRRGCRMLGLPRRKIGFLGDQLFTDVLAARLCGLTPLLVRPVQTDTGAFFRAKRRLERLFWQ